MLFNPANYWKVMVGLVLAILSMAALFLTYPDIDILVSGLFFDPNKSRFAGRSDLFLGLREVVNFGFYVIALTSLGLLINSLLRRKTAVPSPVWGFVVSSLVVGPGILANLILKAYWGRARPDSIEQFGGDRLFTPPLLKTDQCDFNCSFVSGEASSLSSIAILGVLLFYKRSNRRGRAALVLSSFILTVYACFMRIFMGRHFLSDTVFAVLFCATVIWIFWGIFKMYRFSDEVTKGAVWFDLKGAFRVPNSQIDK